MRKLLLIITILFSFSAIAQTPLHKLIRKKAASGGGVTDSLAFMFYGSGQSAESSPTANWNNLNKTSGTAQTFSSLKYLDDGANSGFSLNVGTTSNAVDNGAGYCSSPTDGFPSIVHKKGLYRDATITLTFSSLNNSKKYDLVFLGTRGTSAHGNRLTSQTKTDDIATIQNNCSDAAKVIDLVPSSGEVVATISIISGSFAYLQGLYLIEHD